ncbi:MAG: hypothetical protein AAB781_00375 [Patescibacteria group bacterium]
MYVLDTNILVARKGELDNRIKILPKFFRRFYITEYLEAEKKFLIEKGYQEIFNCKTKVLNFESLRKEFPDTCVLYHNFVTAMHNPAHITSPYFLNEAFINLEKNSYKLNKNQEKVKIWLSDMMASYAKSTYSSTGKPKSEEARILDESYQNHIRKKRKADPKHANYLNDYRSLSLSLINCLLRKTNTTYVTSDSDILIAVCNLTEAIAQQISFKYFILEKIKQEGATRLWRGKEKFRFVIDFSPFKEFVAKQMQCFALSLKEKSFYFRVIFWDQKNQKYVDCLRLNFDKDGRDMMLHSHGQLACPFVCNSNHGNMFRYKYEFTKELTLNVEVYPKSIRVPFSVFVTSDQHKKSCKYIQQNDDFRKFTEFEPPGLPPLFDR